MAEFLDLTPKLEQVAYESPREAATKVMADLARRENERVGMKLVSSDGRLRPEMFKREHGGHLSEEELLQCRSFINEREKSWSPLANEQSRAFHIDRYQVSVHEKSREEIDDEILTRWRTETDFKDTRLVEMAVTACLSRALGKRWVVAGTTKYDDYKHGVDQVIVDRTTGQVVAAFDDFANTASSERKESKYQQVHESARKGGAKITFGFSFSVGKLIRRRLQHVPVFALETSKSEAVAALQEMSQTLEREPGEKERALSKKLITSLVKQANTLAKDTSIHPSIRQGAELFAKSLSEFKRVEPVERRYALAA